MIKKVIATPFQVIFRTEESLEKKIKTNNEVIDFLEYKAKITDVDLEYYNSKIADLMDEIVFCEEIIELKNSKDYIYGLLGGEIASIGALVAGLGIGLCIKKLRK